MSKLEFVDGKLSQTRNMSKICTRLLGILVNNIPPLVLVGEKISDLGCGHPWREHHTPHTTHVYGVRYDGACTQYSCHFMRGRHLDSFIGCVSYSSRREAAKYVPFEAQSRCTRCFLARTYDTYIHHAHGTTLAAEQATAAAAEEHRCLVPGIAFGSCAADSWYQLRRYRTY